MPHISFGYSIKKDADNWISRVYDRGGFFIPQKDVLTKYPEKFLSEIKNANNRNNAHKIACDHIAKELNDRQELPVIKEELRALRASWKNREILFFNALEKLLEKPIYTDFFTGYLTTFFRCPYSEKENWFMINFWSSLPEQLTIIAHEIFHLQFLNQYRPELEEKGLNEEQVQKLKEALTFLLNEKDFFSILLRPDKGYEEHALLRKDLKTLWDETKVFHLFLPEAIKILKKDSAKD